MFTTYLVSHCVCSISGRSRSRSSSSSSSHIGRFQMADTDYIYIRTGVVHLKEGKVKKLLLESSTVNKT